MVFSEFINRVTTLNSFKNNGNFYSLWENSFDKNALKGKDSIFKRIDKIRNLDKQTFDSYIVENRFILFINLTLDQNSHIKYFSLEIFWVSANIDFLKANSHLNGNIQYSRIDYDGYILGDPFSHVQPHYDFSDKVPSMKIGLPNGDILDKILANVIISVCPDLYFKWVLSTSLCSKLKST